MNKIGAKLLNGNRSLNGESVYDLSGAWNIVPGNGAYVAITGGLFAGGKGEDLRFMEGKDPTGAVAPAGVVCFRQVRVLPPDYYPLDIDAHLALEVAIARNDPLPAGLTTVGGGLYLRAGYAHPLPAGLHCR